MSCGNPAEDLQPLFHRGRRVKVVSIGVRHQPRAWTTGCL